MKLALFFVSGLSYAKVSIREYVTDYEKTKKRIDYLKNFGEMINKLYNESPIGDFYIGRYYETGNKLKQALTYYKSGYMKLPEGDPNADAYYENIERVLAKRDGILTEPEN